MRKWPLFAGGTFLVVSLGLVSMRMSRQIQAATRTIDTAASGNLHRSETEAGNVVQHGGKPPAGDGGNANVTSSAAGVRDVRSIQDVQEGGWGKGIDPAELRAELRELREAVRAVSQMEARIQSSLTQLERRQEDIHAELHEVIQQVQTPVQTTTAVVPEAALTLHDTGNVAESVAASEGGTTPEATKPEQQSPTPALPATERNAGEGQDTIHSSGDPSVPINATDPWLNRRNSNVLSGPLELTDSFKKALEQMPVLPKRLHFAWDDADVLTSGIPMITHGVGAMVEANPLWAAKVWTDAEIGSFIETHVAGHDWDLIKAKHIVEKTDLWRLLVLYHIGGLYQDLDRSYNKAPLSELIGSETKMFFPMHHDVNFAQDLMITAPSNPVIKAAIDLNLKFRRLWAEQSGKGPHAREAENVIELGPNTLFYAATSIMFGKRLGTNLRDENGDPARAGAFVRDAMKTSPYLQTYREHGNATICDQVFFYHTECATTWPRKNQFLKLYKRQQWDRDVDAIQVAGQVKPSRHTRRRLADDDRKKNAKAVPRRSAR